MELIPPFWFKQRQCKAEPAGADTYRVTGPNLGEAFLRVVQENGLWRAGLRLSADGADVVSTAAELPSEREAWDAAFELFRNRVIT